MPCGPLDTASLVLRFCGVFWRPIIEEEHCCEYPVTGIFNLAEASNIVKPVE